MDVLRLKDIGLTYFSNNGETKALENISFDVKEGEFISIVGPSGSGKTTLLSIISGLLKATKGEITINGHPVKGKSNDTGYMFQKDLLFEWRTIQKNVYVGLEVQHKKTEENKKYARSLLDKYGLKDFKNKYPHQLSGGMRQRVALIRTLALKPKILLLDEPFSALDYQTRVNMCEDVSAIIKAEHKTTILVTHDISEAISLSDRVIVLSKRPATVKKIYKIDLQEYSSPLEKRKSPKFGRYFNKIWRDLQSD